MSELEVNGTLVRTPQSSTHVCTDKWTTQECLWSHVLDGQKHRMMHLAINNVI